ncbi:hypothetical protein FALBO_6335 [Fusarium albosuccineum]|uniref:Uncharacterized protein n=1 Tax=Fusarium albosuccineum TaxID=1237068 RepID=A0A8H4LFY7_9HYPO|nr:hypothetical protein FALBO_6335 [Fusarium albosuccineum]
MDLACVKFAETALNLLHHQKADNGEAKTHREPLNLYPVNSVVARNNDNCTQPRTATWQSSLQDILESLAPGPETGVKITSDIDPEIPISTGVSGSQSFRSEAEAIPCPYCLQVSRIPHLHRISVDKYEIRRYLAVEGTTAASSPDIQISSNIRQQGTTLGGLGATVLSPAAKPTLESSQKEPRLTYNHVVWPATHDGSSQSSHPDVDLSSREHLLSVLKTAPTTLLEEVLFGRREAETASATDKRNYSYEG